MSKWSGPLPSFKKPPVNEVVLGVVFAELKNLRSAHFGRYWETVRKNYPKTEDQPPLVLADPSGELRIEMMDVPPLRRVWLVSEDESLVQLQANRFHFNWRKAGDDPYPRYESVKGRFFEAFGAFSDFIEKEGIGKIESQQCEASYVNHIPAGDLWKSPDEIAKVFTILAGPLRSPSGTVLSRPDSLAFNARFAFPDEKSNLHLSLKHGKRKSDNAELFVLDLTVRGEPSGTGPKELESWFDFAREVIVRGFADVTTEAAHKVWEREAK